MSRVNLMIAMVTDKQAEHEILGASGLRFTELRPPRLVDGVADAGYQLGMTAPGPLVPPVPRRLVAEAMLDLVANRYWLRASPFLTVATKSLARVA